MASISKDKNGNKLIQFMDGKQRRSVWLGKVQVRVAETWRSRVEELVNAKNEGREPFNETSVWVGRLADKSIYGRFADRKYLSDFVDADTRAPRFN